MRPGHGGDDDGDGDGGRGAAESLRHASIGLHRRAPPLRLLRCVSLRLVFSFFLAVASCESLYHFLTDHALTMLCRTLGLVPGIYSSNETLSGINIYREQELNRDLVAWSAYRGRMCTKGAHGHGTQPIFLTQT
jgi:hypothetical protein